MTGVQLFYTEFFGYFVGVLVGFCSKLDFLFHGRHKQLIVGVLINHANFLIPFFALLAFLPEFIVYVLQNHAASRLFKTGNQS